MSTDGTVRRVITGAGDAFLLDEQVAAVVNASTGLGYWRLWGDDATPVVPAGPDHDWPRTMFSPHPGGHRVHAIEFPAAGELPPGRGDWPPYGLAPGGRFDDPRGGGMHRTDTVDIVIVLAGRIGVEQGDGETKVLGPGDVLVQNGALHAWRLQDVPCRVVVVALGASRDAG